MTPDSAPDLVQIAAWKAAAEMVKCVSFSILAGWVCWLLRAKSESLKPPDSAPSHAVDKP